MRCSPRWVCERAASRSHAPRRVRAAEVRAAEERYDSLQAALQVLQVRTVEATGSGVSTPLRNRQSDARCLLTPADPLAHCGRGECGARLRSCRRWPGACCVISHCLSFFLYLTWNRIPNSSEHGAKGGAARREDRGALEIQITISQPLGARFRTPDLIILRAYKLVRCNLIDIFLYSEKHSTTDSIVLWPKSTVARVFTSPKPHHVSQAHNTELARAS